MGLVRSISVLLLLPLAACFNYLSPAEIRQRVQAGKVSCIVDDSMVITSEQVKDVITFGSWVVVCPESVWMCNSQSVGTGDCTELEALPPGLEVEVARRRGGGRVVIE